jgi:hypothetical protein
MRMRTSTVFARPRRGRFGPPVGPGRGTAVIGLALALGGLFGALVMYVLDPEMGRRRRALARDQAVHAGHVLGADLPEAARGRAQRRLAGLPAQDGHQHDQRQLTAHEQGHGDDVQEADR